MSPERGAEHARGGGAFLEPALGRPVAAELTRRQIAEAYRAPSRSVPRNRAAKTDFQIVGMGPEHQEVDRHGVRDCTSGNTAGLHEPRSIDDWAIGRLMIGLTTDDVRLTIESLKLVDSSIVSPIVNRQPTNRQFGITVTRKAPELSS